MAPVDAPLCDLSAGHQQRREVDREFGTLSSGADVKIYEPDAPNPVDREAARPITEPRTRDHLGR